MSEDQRLNTDAVKSVKSQPAKAGRSSKQSTNRRLGKAAQNRQQTQNRNATDFDRMELFRQAHAQSALPDLPPIPGWHVCWLTSTNSKDSLAFRRRLGYEPIKPEELVGFGEFALGATNTPQAGLICVNEMVAFKLPIDVFNEYMQENHHYAPAREDEKLTDAAQQAKEALQRKTGKTADVGEGVDYIDHMASIRVPDFTSQG
jgi:hypothetical protein